ncbi:MAG: hypothetical protein QGI45_04385 [Myxococcota bacterium]|jgi:hypothetical protein|nr:hypothetical protein [Myxococcota bacterium]
MAPNISSRPTGPVNVPDSVQSPATKPSADKVAEQKTDKVSDSKNNADSSLEITDSKQAKQRRNTLGQAEKRPTDSHQALAVPMPERRITDQIPGKTLKDKTPDVDMSTAAISNRLEEGLEKNSPLNALSQAFNADAKTVESQANEVFFPILRHVKTSQPDLPPAEIKALAQQHIDSMLKEICADVFKDKDSIDTFVETLKDDKDFKMKNSKSPLRALMGTYMDKLQEDGFLSQGKKGKDALATENEKALASWANAAQGETGNAFSASQNHIFSEAVLMAHQAAKGTFDADKAGFAALSIDPPVAAAEPPVAEDKPPQVEEEKTPQIEEDKAPQVPAMIDLPPAADKSPGAILEQAHQNLSPEQQAQDAKFGDPNELSANAAQAQSAHDTLLPSTSVARNLLEQQGVGLEETSGNRLKIVSDKDNALGMLANDAGKYGAELLYDAKATSSTDGNNILLSAEALRSGQPGAAEQSALIQLKEQVQANIPEMIDLPPVAEKTPGQILDGFHQNLSPDRQAKDAELGDPNAMNASAQKAQSAHQGLLPSTSVARAQLDNHGVKTQTLWPHKLQITPEAQSPLGQFALQAQAAGIDVLFDPDAKSASDGKSVLLSADALNTGKPGSAEQAALAKLMAAAPNTATSTAQSTQSGNILGGTEHWEPARLQQSVGLISGKEIGDLDNASPAELLAILRDEPPPLPGNLATTMTNVQEGLTTFGLDRAQIGQAVNAQDFNAAQTLIDTLEEITPGGFRGSMRMALLSDMPALNNYLDGAMNTLGRELPAASDATYQREVLSVAQDYQAHLIKEGALQLKPGTDEGGGKVGAQTLEAHRRLQEETSR